MSQSFARNESPPLLLESKVFSGVAFVLIGIWFLMPLKEAQLILAEHIEPERRNPEATINMLLFLLDRRAVVAAVRRLRAGYGCAL
jgi:hypothetical protein